MVHAELQHPVAERVDVLEPFVGLGIDLAYRRRSTKLVRRRAGDHVGDVYPSVIGDVYSYSCGGRRE